MILKLYLILVHTHSRHQSLESYVCAHVSCPGKLYLGEHVPQGCYSQKLAI